MLSIYLFGAVHCEVSTGFLGLVHRAAPNVGTCAPAVAARAPAICDGDPPDTRGGDGCCRSRTRFRNRGDRRAKEMGAPTMPLRMQRNSGRQSDENAAAVLDRGVQHTRRRFTSSVNRFNDLRCSLLVPEWHDRLGRVAKPFLERVVHLRDQIEPRYRTCMIRGTERGWCAAWFRRS